VIDDLFDSEKMTIEKLRQFNLLHKESFFSRQKHEFAFSSFISHAIKIIIITLINVLIKKTLSTLDLTSKKSDITNDIIDDITDDIIDDITSDFDITNDSDIIDDFDITDDIIDDITEESDITSDTQSITDDTTEDSDITEDSDTTSDTQSVTSDIIFDTQNIIFDTQSIIIDAALKRRRRKNVEESCDCREFDVA
jgi:hypothetical protein